MKNFACYTDLLFKLLVRVRMVSIDYCSRILKVFGSVYFMKSFKVFIMVIRNTYSIFVDTATKYNMCKVIA